MSQAELLGQHNYKNPGSEFHTGHWAINDPDPKKIESISQAYPPRDQDLIATIPPAEQDEHITQEVVLPEQVEEVDLHATRLNPVAFTPVDQYVSDTQPVLIPQTASFAVESKPTTQAVPVKEEESRSLLQTIHQEE